MYERISRVEFPEFRGVMVNMMPFILGDESTLPPELRGYVPLIAQCDRLERGRVAYLTVNESLVTAGASQRRGGVHTEGTATVGWGGGSWGGGSWGGGTKPVEPIPGQPMPAAPSKKLGLYMASTDGSCRIWDAITHDVDSHGGLLVPPAGASEVMGPGMLYWLTDRTPHEALPVARDTKRQFFRLVSHDVGAWWAMHSTPNPCGIRPDCKIHTHSKYGS